MKRWIMCSLIVLCLILGLILNHESKKNTNLTKITVAEVTHSIFYTPWYVALENGYFKDEGLNIEVTLTPGADKVTAAVLSGDAKIGFAGTEASIYVYNNNEKDYIINFAGLTKRDGQFIFGDCKYKDNFKLSDLKNNTVLAGRTGGMPLMNFKYALKNENIDTSKIDINTSVEFSALAGAYIGGNGDFVNLFEPTALSLEKQKYGCVLASIGEYAGTVPYTVFNTTKSYYNNNPKIIKKFTKAINKGLEYTKNNNERKIANIIYKQFPDNSISEIETIIKRYKEADSWLNNTYIDEESYNNLINLMKYNKEIDKYPDYNKIIYNKYNE